MPVVTWFPVRFISYPVLKRYTDLLFIEKLHFYSICAYLGITNACSTINYILVQCRSVLLDAFIITIELVAP